MISWVMTGNVSFCLIRIAMSQANVSQRVLICARRVLFLRTNVVKVLYGETRAKYQARLAATTSSPPSTPATPTATSASTDKDNVPKTLPQGVYAQLIKDYNNITLDGEKRTFPEKILLGADKVLARMYHEHHTSKRYTAVTLGEIMSQRVFTSLGTVNANRKKDDLDKRLIVDNKQQLVTKGPPDWDVRGISMILDGSEAVKWAWILIKFGTEKSVIKHCDWFHCAVTALTSSPPRS